MQKQNLNNLGLKVLTEIKANQFRSKDNLQDFCPFEVESRIIEIKMKQAAKMLKVKQSEVKSSFDSQLAGLLETEMPGKFLLALIDHALKTATFETEVTFQVPEYSRGYGTYYDVECLCDVSITNGVVEILSADVNLVDNDGGDELFEHDLCIKEESLAKELALKEYEQFKKEYGV